MKSVRIISRLDIKGPNVVKGVHLEGLRIVGTPKELARKYEADGADELLYIDIVASLYERHLDFDQLRSTAEKVFIPFTVGGGIRTIKDITDALRAGADKVAINTQALHSPQFLAEAVHIFGSQCIVLSVEAKKTEQHQWEAYTEGGRERAKIDAIKWIKEGIAMGVGEILLTSIDQDGTRKGYDLELAKEVAACAPVPVVAHGGAGSVDDVIRVITDSRVDAASISSLLHYGDSTISAIKTALTSANIFTRHL